MKRLNIALMAGGNSSERGIALQSAAQVAAGLDSAKYDITVVDLHNRDWVHTAEDGSKCEVDRRDFSITIGGEKKIFDYALIIIHGTPGEDGMLQGYLEMMGVPFSSGSMTSSAVTFDKVLTKRAVAGCGVAMAKEILVQRGEVVDADAVVAELGLPMFVKPNASGSSFGVSKVKAASELQAAIDEAFIEGSAVLIEEALVGREVSCGVMITSDGREYLMPITEMVTSREFFDHEAKYTPGLCEEITPAKLDAEVVKKLNDRCLATYKACRCRGVVRIDFIISESGEPYMIEVNSIPGMSSGSIIPQQIRAAGMTVGEFYDIVIEDTYRSQTEGK